MRAHYMRWVKGHHGASDRVGGLPSLLPPAWPTGRGGIALEFLAQFEVDGDRIRLAGASYIQLFQMPGVDDGSDPFPVALRVDAGAVANHEARGRGRPELLPWDIHWESAEDPDDEPDLDPAADADLRVFHSKAGGYPIWEGDLPEGARYLLQLDEEPAGFNFGGLTAVVFETADGEVRATLV